MAMAARGSSTVGTVETFNWVRRTGARLLASLRERVSRPSARATREVPRARVARSGLGARLAARDAVQAGVRLDDFLRHRLAVYAGGLPVPLHRLPWTIEIQDGEAVARIPAAAPRSAAAAKLGEERPRWLRALADRDGPHAAAAVRQSELRVAHLDERVEATRERVDALCRALEADVAEGVVKTPPRVLATPEQLGRPEVPEPLVPHAAQGFALALLGAEVWRFAGPALEALGAGADPVAALKGAPVVASIALAFASAMAVSVFALARSALGRLDRALAEAPRRREGVAGLAAGGGAIAVAVGSALPGPWTAAVLVAVVPFAAAAALTFAERRLAARAAALEAALAWDRVRAAEAAAYGRRLEAIERARGDLAALERDRELESARLTALVRRGLALEEAEAAAARLEAGRLERLAEALAGALEQDRFLFLRHAAEAHRSAARRPMRLEPPVAQPLGIAAS